MEVTSGKGGNAILLMLPKEVASQVIEWGQKNIPPEALSGLPNKGYDKSPHITLVMGIVDEEPEKALGLLDSHGPINITLGPVECFRKHDKGYDVIKISVESPELNKLNADILGSLAVNDPVHPFSPHITIAYVKPYSCEHLLGNGEFKDLELPIDAYVYSDREKGGKVKHLKKGEPLKESLDYSIQDLASHLNKNTRFIQSMTSKEIARTIIAIQLSNKTV